MWRMGSSPHKKIKYDEDTAYCGVFFVSALNYKEETLEKNQWKIIGKRCKINEKML